MNKRDNINVLLVSPVPPPVGGDSTWAFKYLEYFKKCNYPIHLVNTSMIGSRALSVSDSVRIHDEIRRCFRIWTGIVHNLIQKDIDVVHLNTNCSPRGVIRDYISVCIIKMFKKPLIVHCRCNVGDQINKSSFGKLILRKLLNKSNRVFVQNSFSFEYVNRELKIDEEKIRNMPNYIEDDYLIQEKNISRTVKTAVFVGHVRRTKGIDELIYCAKQFSNIQFIIVGPITEDYSTDNFAVDNIRLLGDLPPEKVKDQLDSADIFLFPTYTEGFSNSLLEAMARGMPIITTNVGANKDMLENVGGIIVNPMDKKELANAITSILPESERIKESKWNIKKVKDEYLISSVVNKIRQEYLMIIGR